MIFQLHYTITNRIQDTISRQRWALCKSTDDAKVYLTQRGEYLSHRWNQLKRRARIRYLKTKHAFKQRIPELTALPFYITGYTLGFVVKSVLWLKDSTIAGYDKARREDEYVY